MRLKKNIALLFLLFVAHSHVVSANVPRPLLDLTQLTSDAKIIVVGEVVSILEGERGSFDTQGRTILAQRMKAILRVERVLKGESNIELSFNFLIPDQWLSFASISRRQHGMFFLRPNQSELEPASHHYPFILAARQGCRPKEKGLTGVVGELGCILQSPSSNIRERAESINALRSVKTAEANSVLDRAARELVAPLNLLAAGILISRDEISMLPMIESVLMRTATLVVEGDGYRSEHYLSLVLEEVKNPEAIPALSRLLESIDAKTRRGAAKGLRSIGTKAAIKPLAKALDDSDWEVRWVAVMGLAGIAGPDKDGTSWYPAYDEFKRNELRYLNHWREWLAKQSQ